MSSIEVKPKTYNYVFSSHIAPAVRAKPGDKVILYTDDAFESRIKKKSDLPSKALETAKFLNPQTGPIYVEGAEPGDTLVANTNDINKVTNWISICYYVGHN